MNSFKPVFYGRITEKDGKGHIEGFFAWPMTSIGLLLALLAFLLLQNSILEPAGLFVSIMILLMFTLVWLFCKFMARHQVTQIKEYLIWLTNAEAEIPKE